MSPKTSTDLFHHDDYRTYLAERLSTTGADRGGRSKFADYIGCRLSFVSVVLSGQRHLNLEHAHLATQFLKLNSDETDYFILLHLKNKAGSKAAEAYFEKKLAIAREQQNRLSRHTVGAPRNLGVTEQAIYYSDWIYAAVHMALTIPELQSAERLRKFLRYPGERIDEVLAFLASTGLAVEQKGEYRAGAARIHLDENAPLRARHHENWRLRAIRSLESRKPEDLHYSSVFSADPETIARIREMIMKMVKESDERIRDAKETNLQSFCIDYFSLDGRRGK